MNILVADSDAAMTDMLAGWLKTRLCQVYCAYKAQEVEKMWLEHGPEFVVLDRDFLDKFKQLHTKKDAWVIVIAHGKDVFDEILCLDAGVDDYLHKPFHPKQLEARLNALGRRRRVTLKQRVPSIDIGPIHFDVTRSTVEVNGKIERLTPKESRLLQLLALNANEICTLEEIVREVWGDEYYGSSHLIKAQIRSLRKKIELNSSYPEYIISVPREGYVFRN